MNELIKLEEYLKEHSIPYKRDLILFETLSATNPSDLQYSFNQIIVYRDKDLKKLWFDVIWHKWSFGYKEGLLELMDSEGDVEGHLTADDVIRRYFENEEV